MDKSILYQSRILFYRTEGMGLIPLVLLHGFAEDGAIWDNQVEHLKKNYPLIIPDLPGSGRSSPLPSATSISGTGGCRLFPHYCRCTKRSNDAILIEVIAWAAVRPLAFVEKYPDRCAGVGLFHSTAYPDTEEKKTTRKKSMAFILKRRRGIHPPVHVNLFADLRASNIPNGSPG